MEAAPEIITVYARAKAIERTIAQLPQNAYVRPVTGKDITSCVTTLSKIAGIDYSYLTINHSDTIHATHSQYGDCFVPKQLAESRIYQLVNILESVYGCGDRGTEAGIAYNFIQDVSLKSRCSDLLSADKHFDRVINQATQVFEERIRELSELGAKTGAALVDEAISGTPDKIIRFSEDPLEHRGYFFICKGIVDAFRNPTHHRIIDTITREDALKFCGFIDTMLGILNRCTVVNNKTTC